MVQFSVLNLAMDLAWISETPPLFRSSMISSGLVSVGRSDAVLRVTTNETVAAYSPLQLSYRSDYLYAENFVLSLDAGASVLETGGTRSVILPPSVGVEGGDICLTLPVFSSLPVELAKTDPIMLTFRVESIRKRTITNATITISGDDLLENTFSGLL